jgi:dTMP kinase
VREGILISLEGVEGSGKSTQLNLLTDHLKTMGRKVLKVREPGGTELGERVRTLLLEKGGPKISPLAELFLYFSSRAQLVEEVLRPALDAGLVILCDRYMDATVAYQGYGRGLDVGLIEQVNRFVVGDALPDLTFLLDLEADAGLGRIFGRGRDRLEAEGLAFHERVRKGYLEVAARNSRRIKIIRANREILEIAAEIRGYVTALLATPMVQG